MIRVENLSGGYGSNSVIKDISFHVEKGNSLLFLGPMEVENRHFLS